MGKFFVLLILLLPFIGITQTQSDSLYFSKFYKLDKGYLLIGSETKGSFRKCVIRKYDSDLNIAQQRYERSMRNSDVFLDGNYGDILRVISRYRWNRGKVYLYGNDLELNTIRFFKRDDYKDWMKTEDESYDIPVERGEKLKGLNPVLYKNDECHYFSTMTNEIYHYSVDVSFIKPVYNLKNKYNLKKEGEIQSYKWIEDGNLIWLYVSSIKNVEVIHQLNLINEKAITINVPLKSNYKLHISDVFIQDNQFFIGGSYMNSDAVATEGFINYKGNFVFVFKMNEKKELEQIAESYNELEQITDDAFVGSRMQFHGLHSGKIQIIFENLIFKKKEVNFKDGLSLSGSYYTYSPFGVSLFSFETDHQFKIKNFKLTFQRSDENGVIQNQYRTFHNLKGQKQSDLLFNGLTIYNYNDPFVEFVNFESGLMIYGDRNYNYFQSNIYDETLITPLLLNKNKNQRKCYFENDFYISYYKTEWGFKLEKLKY